MPRQGEAVWTAAAVLIATTVLLPPISMARDAANGKEVYATRCTKCHGPDERGSRQVAQILQAEIPDLTSKAVQAKKDRELLQIITKGRGKMAAFEWSLEMKDREDVVVYIRTMGTR